MDDTTHDAPATESSSPSSSPGISGPSMGEVDAEVRAKLTGQPVAVIAEQAEKAFATIGVRITGEQLADYADAVSSGSAFAFEPVAED